MVSHSWTVQGESAQAKRHSATACQLGEILLIPCESRVQNLGITKFGQRQEVLEALAELNANVALIGQLKNEMANTNTDGGSWASWM